MRVLMIFALILLACTSLFATIPTENLQQTSIHINSKSVSENSVNISQSIENPEWLNFNDEQVGVFAYLEGTSLLLQEGNPIVPVSGRLIQLPVTGGARVEINSADFELLTDLDYARYFENTASFDELNELNDSWFPENIITVGQPAILHDLRVASIITSPVQVNPARREVRVYQNIDYTISFDVEDNSNSLSQQPQSISELFLPYYKEMLNWQESWLDEIRVYRGKVMVVVEDNALIMNALEPWLEWKREKGWEIEFLTSSDVNWTRNAIRSELINRYAEAEVKFDYVVVIGDAMGAINCPPGTISSPDYYGAGDQGYATLAGDDDLVDVAVGRISVESILELNIYVNKLLSYEKEPYMEETDWFGEGLVAAGSEISGISTIYTCEYARDRMMDTGYNEVHTAYFNDGLGEVNPRIEEILNDGVGFHLYRGVMGSGLTVEEILGLQNNFKIPAVIDITCGRGDWGNSTSINEAYMRAGNTTIPRGGIACISTATTSTNTRFNNSLTGGAIAASMVHHHPAMGAMLIGAKVNMWNNLYDIDYSDVVNFNTWTNLMGDPTVWIWTGIPRELTVTADSEINIGSNGFEVLVSDNAGPVEGAWVTLYRNDAAEEIRSHGVTGADGRVLLESSFSEVGNAILTVTAQNYHPVQQDINITNSINMLGFTYVSIIDDGNFGTSGNDNGLADYGETVGLVFTFHNYGLDPEANISYSIESEDPAVVSIQGSGNITNLAANQNYTMNNPALVELDADVEDGCKITIDVHLQNMNGNYTDSYALEAHAPVYNIEIDRYNEGLVPGLGGNLNLNIINAGSADGSASSINLSCEDNWLNFETGNLDFNALSSGSCALTDPFTIMVDGLAFPGYSFDANLEITFNNGRVQNIPFKLGLEEPGSDAPIGPDNYGYSAFEDCDENFDLSQSYNWVEINPVYEENILPGILLDISDTSANDDTSIVVDLPFEFQYYGEIYDQVTVCSNGWISLGDESNYANQRNWTIPSPLGPDAMIAPYWDDRTTTIDGGIYYYASASEKRAIIQWEDVADAVGNYPSTFQVILYANREDNPTPENDGEFRFQYKNIHHSQGGFADIPYWTTGMENHLQNDGLQLAYNNEYSPGVEGIYNEHSIFFTTRRDIEYGTVEGIVINQENNQPLENVRVSSCYLGTYTFTDQTGYYSIQAAEGENSIVYSLPYFETQIVNDIAVISGQTVTQDAGLYPPTFTVSPSQVNVYLEFDEIVNVDLTLANFGDTLVDYTAELWAQNPDGQTNVTGEIFQTINLQDFGITDMVMSMNYRENQLWVATMDGWWDDSPVLNVFDLEGNLIENHTLNFYLLDMSWQADTLYAFAYFNTYKYLYENSSLSLIYSSDEQIEEVACIAIDSENQFLYAGSEYTMERFNLDYTSSGLMSTAGRITSIRIVPDDPLGKVVHFICSHFSPEYYVSMQRIFPNGSGEETVCTMDFSFDCYPRVAIFNQENHLTSTLATYDSNEEQNLIHLRNYLPIRSIATLSQDSGTVNESSEDILTLTFDGSIIPEGTFENWLVIDHSSFGGRIIIPITVESNETSVETTVETLPDHWGLDNVWPNPFNPKTTASFSLIETNHVKLKLYNIMGQEVLSIIDSNMQAGSHTVVIDGTSLSSGIYFLKLNAGPVNEVRKLMLVK